MSAAALVAVTACSPSDPLLAPCPVTTGSAGAGGAGAGGAGGAGGSGLSGPDTLVVDVVRTGLDDFMDQQPAAGAVVALDLPAGEDWRRVEQTVGSDGRVTFEGLDWSLPGSGAVTAYLPGYLPQSFAGLTEASADVLAAIGGTDVLTVYLQPVEPEMVRLSGLATPMLEPGNNWLNVYATTHSALPKLAVGPSWTLEVRAGAPFTLLAREGGPGSVPTSPRGASFKPGQKAVLEHEPVSSDEVGILIDFGSPPPELTIVSGSFDVPSHGISGFFEEGRGRVGVRSQDSGGMILLGGTDWVDVTADGSAFEYDLSYNTLAAVELPWSYVRMYRGVQAAAWGTAAEQSRLAVPGYPTAGLQPGVLPEPAQLAAFAPVTLGETLGWEMNAVDTADPQLRVDIVMRDEMADALRWRLTAPPGTTELRLPAALPSNADPDEVLGPGGLVAFIEHCEPVLTPEAYRGLCRRWSHSVAVRILRPAAWGSPEGSSP